MTEQHGERLQKVLARAGFGSRRACEELIRAGRVAVGGQVARELGTRVLPKDEVAVDGRAVPRAPEKEYILLNKPRGYITTFRDPDGRPSVLDLLPPGARLFPVGRLDIDSEGLLLLTNDGDLTYRMTHPRFGIEKEYRVLVQGRPDVAALRRLREGVVIDGRPTAPARITIAARGTSGTWLRVVIHEGRKRQIRRMCEAVGLAVLRLTRTRVGPLRLGRLAHGESRMLTDKEVQQLREHVGTVSRPPLVVAIDGPAGSGKSALAQGLVRRCNLLYLDTGALYRAVTLLALRLGIDPHDQESVSRLADEAQIAVVPSPEDGDAEPRVLANGQDVTGELHTPEVGRHVSIVAAYPGVRQALLSRQREIARRGNVVMVGRDISTVVFPEAPIKVYLEASPEVRATRRQDQLRERGIDEPFDRVLAEIHLRDKLDSERAIAPLTVAPDAIVLNSDRLTVEEETRLVEAAIRRYQDDKQWQD